MADTKPPFAGKPTIGVAGRTGGSKAISANGLNRLAARWLLGMPPRVGKSSRDVEREFSVTAAQDDVLDVAEAEALATLLSADGRAELSEMADAASWLALKSEAERVSGLIDLTVDHVRVRLAQTDA